MGWRGLGLHLYGLAAVLFGALAFAFHDFNLWQQVQPLGLTHGRELLLYAVAVVQIVGGLAVQSTRTARAGAVALGLVYLLFATLWLPLFIENPHIFDRLDNFFEEFSMVAGALIVYATTRPHRSRLDARLARTGYYCFGVCVIAFALEQLVYLHGTAHTVPRWLPPGQMFWAIATTACFALAAIALLTRRFALVAARLLTAMIVGFGLLVWLPALFTHPHSYLSWAGNAENGGIAAAAWIVAAYLAKG